MPHHCETKQMLEERLPESPQVGAPRNPSSALVLCLPDAPPQHLPLTGALCTHVLDLSQALWCRWIVTPGFSALRGANLGMCAGLAPRAPGGTMWSCRHSACDRHPWWLPPLPVLTSTLSCWYFLKFPPKTTTCTQTLS